MAKYIKKQNDNNNQKKERYFGSVKFFKHCILSLVGLAIIIPTTIAIVLYIRDNQDDGLIPRDTIETQEGGGRGIVLDPDNFESVLEDFQKPIEDATYIVSMSTEWEFDSSGKASRSTYVENYEDNTRTVYIDVYLDDEEGNANKEELILSSPYIPVGREMKNFTLDKQVPVGDYTATVVFYLVDDEYNVITDLSVGIRLIVK